MSTYDEDEAKERRRNRIFAEIEFVEPLYQQYTEYVKCCERAANFISIALGGLSDMQNSQNPNVKNLCDKGISPCSNLLTELDFKNKNMDQDLYQAATHLETVHNDVLLRRDEYNRQLENLYYSLSRL